MSELGQWLRETRQARELSLEQVEAETRIRAKFLAAIEEESYGELPGDIYIRGFLRNYALFLGLDPQEVLEKYEKRDSAREGEPGLFRPLEVTMFRATADRLRSRLLLLVLIVGALTVGLWAWKTGRLVWPSTLVLFRRTAPATATPTPTQMPGAGIFQTPTRPPEPSATAQATATHTPGLMPSPTSTPGILVAPTSTSSPTPAVSSDEPPTVTRTPTEESMATTATPTTTATSLPAVGVTVAITVTESSWVEVTVDSLSAFWRLMEAGEQGTWEARREIILRLGNAGGVQVTVNGDSLGTLGERQQVVEFAWGPEGEVTPEPTATATPEALEEGERPS